MRVGARQRGVKTFSAKGTIFRTRSNTLKGRPQSLTLVAPANFPVPLPTSSIVFSSLRVILLQLCKEKTACSWDKLSDRSLILVEGAYKACLNLVCWKDRKKMSLPLNKVIWSTSFLCLAPISHTSFLSLKNSKSNLKLHFLASTDWVDTCPSIDRHAKLPEGPDSSHAMSTVTASLFFVL